MICVALDDEQKALDVVSMYCERVEGLALKATFTDAVKASQYLSTTNIDLLFLDINMPDLNGFEFLESLTQKPMVIFTTAYSEFAVRSYQVDALDYLLKPITFGLFVKAVNKAKARLNDVKPKVIEKKLVEESEKLISIKSGNAYHRIDRDKIALVQSDGNYVKIFVGSNPIMALMSMKEVAMTLGESFLQIHRTYLVPINKITKVENHQLTVGEHTVPIGVSFRKKVREKLSSYLK